MEERATSIASHKSALFAVFAAVLACVFDYLFVWEVPGISAPIFAALIAGAFCMLCWTLRRKPSRESLLLIALALFFSAMVAIRANELLTLLNMGAALLVLALATEVSFRSTMKDLCLMDYLSVLGLSFTYLTSFIETITTIQMPAFEAMNDTSKQILRGILMTVPVVLFFAALFAGADPVFNKALSLVLGLHIDLFVSPVHLYVFGVMFVFMCGALGYAFSKERTEKSPASVSKRPMGSIEASILLGSVNALFLTFIALQASYLFGGIANILNDSYTYAEYARRGFFELIAISAFTYLILFAAERLIERNAERHSKRFKYLSAAMVLQVMVLMIFAFNRLSLYESAFGFTTLRLYSHAFIVLLAAVYVSLLYKIFINAGEAAFALRTFIIIAMFVAGMDLMNPDLFIAQKNLERLNDTGKIDIAYISELSPDAAPVAMEIFNKSDAAGKSLLGHALFDTLNSMPQEWQSWNLSRVRAQELLRGYADQLTAYQNYQAPLVSSDEGEI